MLTRVEAYNARGETLALPLGDISDGFVIQEIDGLDPVKATIVTSSFAQRDGSQYQASRRENRNLVFTLGLEPNYASMSVQSLRNRLYRFFMPKTSVTLKFYVDGQYFGYILGRVESLETTYFSETPEVKISLICFDPDFLAPSSVVVSGYSVTDSTELGVLYPGTVEAGFVFRINVNQTVPELVLYNRTPDGELHSFDFVFPMRNGDILEVSTVPGNKYAKLTRDGSDTSVLYGVSPGSIWLPLFPGTNNFRVSFSGAPMPWTIEYTAKYGAL